MEDAERAELNALTRQIIGSAIKVHRVLVLVHDR